MTKIFVPDYARHWKTNLEAYLIKENTDSDKGGIAYEVNGIPLMKVSEESYRTYQDTQAGAISYVGSEDGMFYMDCFMEGMDEYIM